MKGGLKEGESNSGRAGRRCNGGGKNRKGGTSDSAFNSCDLESNEGRRKQEKTEGIALSGTGDVLHE